MTTKLYGGDKRLFTAAEARRIDIERGGEGKIYRPDRHRVVRVFDENYLVWKEDEEYGDGAIDKTINCESLWLPLTPEPEQPWSDKSQSELRIEQLEKELAEATQNYHEILADHGELTRKFDELKESSNPLYLSNALNCVRQLQEELATLKEATRRKSCRDEKPTKANPITYSCKYADYIGRGYYDATNDTYYLKLQDLIALPSEQVETWTWKYEADL